MKRISIGYFAGLMLAAAAFLAVMALAAQSAPVPVYEDNGKLRGYVDPEAPDYDRSQFCDISDPNCFPDIDGPAEDDGEAK